LWKILPNYAGQVAKFCSLPWQNYLNFSAHLSLPFVSKLTSVVFKNFLKCLLA